MRLFNVGFLSVVFLAINCHGGWPWSLENPCVFTVNGMDFRFNFNHIGCWQLGTQISLHGRDLSGAPISLEAAHYYDGTTRYSFPVERGYVVAHSLGMISDYLEEKPHLGLKDIDECAQLCIVNTECSGFGFDTRSSCYSITERLLAWWNNESLPTMCWLKREFGSYYFTGQKNVGLATGKKVNHPSLNIKLEQLTTEDRDTLRRLVEFAHIRHNNQSSLLNF